MNMSYGPSSDVDAIGLFTVMNDKFPSLMTNYHRRLSRIHIIGDIYRVHGLNKNFLSVGV
ncbi:hypothetical protein Bpfe_010147, partial [Biomphalaria pfeifferi]